MKRTILLLLLALLLTLTACHTDPAAGPTLPTSTKPTAEPTAEPTLEPTIELTEPTELPTEPTEPHTDYEQFMLEELTKLFGNANSWYNYAVNHCYNLPEEIDLSYFFMHGFNDEMDGYTDIEEQELLGRPGFDVNLELTRLPVSKMEATLQRYFGISLQDISEENRHLTYLESTDCYYISGGGAYDVMDFEAIDMETKDDGTIALFYTRGGHSHKGVVYEVGLKPHWDGYQILYNRIAKPSQGRDYSHP